MNKINEDSKSSQFNGVWNIYIGGSPTAVGLTVVSTLLVIAVHSHTLSHLMGVSDKQWRILILVVFACLGIVGAWRWIHSVGVSQRYRRFMLPVPIIVLLVLIASSFLISREAVISSGQLLVGHFDNQTNVPELAAALRSALIKNLKQSKSIQLIHGEAIRDALSRMRLEPMTRVDEAIGRKICQRDGIHALVIGNIKLLEERGYALELQLIDPFTEDQIPPISEEASSEKELLEKVVSLTRHILEALGETPIMTHSLKPLSKVTTPSLDALKEYSKATELNDLGKFRDALPHVEKTIRYDGGFAAAHLLRSIIYLNLGEYEKAKQSATEAFKRKDRATERERGFIEGFYYDLEEDYEEAEEAYRELSSNYPNDWKAASEYSMILLTTSQYETAQQILKDIINNRNPKVLATYINFALACVYTGQFIDAQRNGFEALIINSNSPKVFSVLGLAYLGDHQNERARNQFQQLVNMGDQIAYEFGKEGLVVTALSQGRFKEARTHLRALRDLSSYNEYWRLEFLLLDSIDDKVALKQQLDILIDNLDNASFSDVAVAAAVAARRGYNDVTNRLLTELEGHTTYAWHAALVNWVRGEIEFAQGKHRAAMKLLKSASNKPPHEASLLIEGSLARAYLESGDPNQAIEAYQAIISKRKGVSIAEGVPQYWVIAHARLAQAYKKADDEENAERYYHDFLAQWNKADADVPLLSHTRAELDAIQMEQIKNVGK